MDANKIKFIDDDGSVEVLEPPMTARVHVETLIDELIPKDRVSQTIEEESSSDEDIVISCSAEGEINDIEDISSSVEMNPVIATEVIEDLGSSIEDAIEQHVKEIEKMDNVLLVASQPPSAPFSEREQGTPDVIKMDEVNVPEQEEIDKETLSLVSNAVQEVHALDNKPITPKGCCILQ